MNENVYWKCRQSEYDTGRKDKKEGNKYEEFNRI